MKTLHYDKNVWVDTKIGFGLLDDTEYMVRPHEANQNEENRIIFATSVAGVTRGKESVKNPRNRYNSLLMEASSNNPEKPDEKTASRIFEFIPVRVPFIADDKNVMLLEQIFTLEDFTNKLGRFSFMYEDETLITNVRALVNLGIPYENIPYNKPSEVADFTVIEANVPMFVWAQLNTHQLLSKVSLTDRIIKKDNQLFFPEDIEERVNKKLPFSFIWEHIDFFGFLLITSWLPLYYRLNIRESLKDLFINEWPMEKVQNFLKELGYKKEIYQRYPNYATYKQWIFSGNKADPFSLFHFLKERQGIFETKGNWVQKETKEVAKLIAEEINFVK